MKEVYIMPLVHIELFEGRTVEQKAAIAREVTDVISKHTGVPLSAVEVIFNDMREGNFYEAGEMRKKK